MANAHTVWHRIIVVVRSGIVAFVIALGLQGVWSALIIGNLKTTPAIPWSVVVIALLV